MPKMRINLARSAGFCFGVRRAIRMAQALASSPKPVYMLGDLVHNETVINELQAAGLRKIKRLGRGRQRILLIRAHGAPRSQITQARQRGYQIVDATCPMVREIHRIVRRMDRRGYRIIVIGDRHHDEVRGIAGQIRRRALVIAALQDIPWAALRRWPKAALVIQSTQNLDRIMPIIQTLQTTLPLLVCFNTICRPTRMKQEETRILPLRNDVILVIGSRSSANTRRLYEIARALNPRTHWIETAQEIKAAWLSQASKVGLTAGASTPDSTRRAVIKTIRRLAQANHKTSAK